jgi:hypothetical protein
VCEGKSYLHRFVQKHRENFISGFIVETNDKNVVSTSKA